MLCCANIGIVGELPEWHKVVPLDSDAIVVVTCSLTPALLQFLQRSHAAKPHNVVIVASPQNLRPMFGGRGGMVVSAALCEGRRSDNEEEVRTVEEKEVGNIEKKESEMSQAEKKGEDEMSRVEKKGEDEMSRVEEEEIGNREEMKQTDSNDIITNENDRVMYTTEEEDTHDEQTDDEGDRRRRKSRRRQKGKEGNEENGMKNVKKGKGGRRKSERVVPPSASTFPSPIPLPSLLLETYCRAQNKLRNVHDVAIPAPSAPLVSCLDFLARATSLNAACVGEVRDAAEQVYSGVAAQTWAVSLKTKARVKEFVSRDIEVRSTSRDDIQKIDAFQGRCAELYRWIYETSGGARSRQRYERDLKEAHRAKLVELVRSCCADKYRARVAELSVKKKRMEPCLREYKHKLDMMLRTYPLWTLPPLDEVAHLAFVVASVDADIKEGRGGKGGRGGRGGGGKCIPSFCVGADELDEGMAKVVRTFSQHQRAYDVVLVHDGELGDCAAIEVLRKYFAGGGGEREEGGEGGEGGGGGKAEEGRSESLHLHTYTSTASVPSSPVRRASSGSGISKLKGVDVDKVDDVVAAVALRRAASDVTRSAGGGGERREGGVGGASSSTTDIGEAKSGVRYRLVFQCSLSMYRKAVYRMQLDKITKVLGEAVVDYSQDATNDPKCLPGNFPNYAEGKFVMPQFLHSFV